MDSVCDVGAIARALHVSALRRPRSNELDEMRNDTTNAEARLWAHLRKGQMGWRFRRQHVVAGFIVDFYCAALKVAVEVDGPVHDGRRDYDVWRDESLRQLGVAIV